MSRTLRAIATASIIGALVTIPVAGALAAFPGQSSIAFIRQTAGGTRLFQMRPNGTELEPLGPMSDGTLFAAAMSPDGRRVAISKYDTGFDLFVHQIGGRTTQITDTPNRNEWSPMWSPDGSRIVFVEQQTPDGSTSIVTRRADGTGRRVVWSSTLGSAFDPSWSPDGERILLSAIRSAPTGPTVVFDLATVRVDGTGRRWLTQTPAREVPGDWSPDGKRIVFVQYVPGAAQNNLFSMRSTGGGRKLVSDRARIALMRALYTPDGKRIVLGRSEDGVELVSTPVGGGVFKKLTDTVDAYNVFDLLYLAG